MRIAFLGDLVLRNPELHILGEHLQIVLDGCDIKVLNFEVPVSVSNAVGIHKSGPVHSQSPLSPQWVKEKGFNLVTLANNHSLDYGQEGVKATLESFSDINITGVGTYESAYDVSIIERNGEKIGFLGLTHKEFGCVDVESGNLIGTAMLTSPKAIESIITTRPKIDRLFVIAHAGVEYMDAPLPEWRELYKSFINLGADGVIASHPHVPQGWEIYNGAPIIYSLGNFLFEVPKLEERDKRWTKSLMVIIDTSADTIDVIPLKYDFYLHKVDIDMSNETIENIRYLNSLIKTDETYSEFIQNTNQQLLSTYHNMMVSGGAYSLGIKEQIKNLLRPILGRKKVITDPIHLLNLFQCESHRWTMMRLLGRKLDIYDKHKSL